MCVEHQTETKLRLRIAHGFIYIVEAFLQLRANSFCL